MKPIRLVLFLCLVLLLAAYGEQTAPAPTPDAIPAAAAESFVPEPKLAFRGDDWALRASLDVLAYSS